MANFVVLYLFIMCSWLPLHNITCFLGKNDIKPPLRYQGYILLCLIWMLDVGLYTWYIVPLSSICYSIWKTSTLRSRYSVFRTLPLSICFHYGLLTLIIHMIYILKLLMNLFHGILYCNTIECLHIFWMSLYMLYDTC